MGSVGLFDAKTHFSEYVARAEAGEEVIITRHNKPVAKIVPLASADARTTTFDPVKRRRAIAMIDQMKAQWRAANGEPQSGLSVAMVREMRDERSRALTAPLRRARARR